MEKEKLKKDLDRILIQISNCDNKASILLAVIGIIVGLTTSAFSSLSFVKNLINNIIENNTTNIILAVLISTILLSYLICFIIAFIELILVLIARTESKKYKKCENKKSLIYFGDITNFPYEEFSKKIDNQTDNDINEDLKCQIYINAKICAKKFKFYNKSVKWVICATILAIISVIINCLI